MAHKTFSCDRPMLNGLNYGQDLSFCYSLLLPSSFYWLYILRYLYLSKQILYTFCHNCQIQGFCCDSTDITNQWKSSLASCPPYKIKCRLCMMVHSHKNKTTGATCHPRDLVWAWLGTASNTFCTKQADELMCLLHSDSSWLLKKPTYKHTLT